MKKKNASFDLGDRLKKYRVNRGITLEEVSKATGLSASFLSLVENKKSGISFANLQKILKCFNLSIHDLINPSIDNGRVVRFAEAERIHSDIDDVEILSLVNNSDQKKIWPGLFIMEPGASIGEVQHEGEEFSYVIQGKIEVTLTDTQTGRVEKYIIHKGDTIYYPSQFLHKYKNLSTKQTIFIAAVTPPTF